jgi:hypothetical protein
VLTGYQEGDEVEILMTGRYDTKMVGTDKVITMVYELTGKDASEYALIATGLTITGEIFAKPLSID